MKQSALMTHKEKVALFRAFDDAKEYLVRNYPCGVPSPQEKLFETFILRHVKPSNLPFYHGGDGGLQVGDILVPGADIGLLNNGNEYHHLVFISHQLDLARSYRDLSKKTGLYRVSPNGKFGIDILNTRLIWAMINVTKFPVLSKPIYASCCINQFTCESATILEVLE